MKNTKFWLAVLGCAVIVATALTKTMDANVALSLSVVVGGYFGGNTLITRAALANGKDGEA